MLHFVRPKGDAILLPDQ